MKLHLTSRDDECWESFDELVTSLLPGNRTIRYLLLAHTFVVALEPNHWDRLLRAIGRMEHLEELEIRNGRIPLSAVWEALQPCTSLVKLAAGFTVLEQVQGFQEREQGVPRGGGHPTLRKVCLSEFRMGTIGQQQQPPPTAMEGLAIGGNHDGTGTADDNTTTTGGETLDSFMLALSQCPNLEEVEVLSGRSSSSGEDDAPREIVFSPSSLASLFQAPHLQTVTIRRVTALNGNHARGVADVLRGIKPNPPFTEIATTTSHACSHLKHLDLSENDIGDEGSLALIQCLGTPGGGHLRSINLRDCDISSQGCKLLIQTLQDHFTTTNFTPGTPEPGDESARPIMTLLERLNLTGNRIGNTGALAIADLLQSNPTSSLKHLALARTDIGDEGCLALAAALRVNTSLLSLSLAYNSMTTVSFVGFAQALCVNRTLKSINLQVVHSNTNEIGMEAYKALADMLVDNMVLEDISTQLQVRDDRNAERRHAKWMVKTYLKLNRAGRHNLLKGYTARKEDWIALLEEVSMDFYAIFYLLRVQPDILECLR